MQSPEKRGAALYTSRKLLPLKQCVTARAALAELKQAVELIPNPGMLINTLPILEVWARSTAASSST